MPDKVAERRRRNRERVLETYRTAYAIPFWTAYREHRSDDLQKFCTRGSDFKLGVAMADPHGKWCKRFNAVDEAIEKELGIIDIVVVRWTEESEDE